MDRVGTTRANMGKPHTASRPRPPPNTKGVPSRARDGASPSRSPTAPTPTRATVQQFGGPQAQQGPHGGYQQGPAWGHQQAQQHQPFGASPGQESGWQGGYGPSIQNQAGQHGAYQGQGHLQQGYGQQASQGYQGYEGGSQLYGGPGAGGAIDSGQERRFYGQNQFAQGQPGQGHFGQFGQTQGSGWAGSPGQYGQQRQGKAPKNYTRSDDRLKDIVCDSLIDHGCDCSEVEVGVNDGVVNLSGSVHDRGEKHQFEWIAASINGVQDVENRLNVDRSRTDSGYGTWSDRDTQPAGSVRDAGKSGTNVENKRSAGNTPSTATAGSSSARS